MPGSLALLIAVVLALVVVLFAEFERSIIQERIAAGIARARVVSTRSGKPIGRARIGATKEAAIRTALASGKGILKTARECRTGTSAVQRIKAEIARGNNPTCEER